MIDIDDTKKSPPSRKNILVILRRELSELELDELSPEVDEGVHFRKDLGMDSLTLAEYIARLEQVFQVEIADEEWQQLTTLGLAADYVERWYAEQGVESDTGH